eukprot:4824671-Amphidinium_carterae.1
MELQRPIPSYTTLHANTCSFHKTGAPPLKPPNQQTQQNSALQILHLVARNQGFRSDGGTRTAQCTMKKELAAIPVL